MTKLITSPEQRTGASTRHQHRLRPAIRRSKGRRVLLYALHSRRQVPFRAVDAEGMLRAEKGSFEGGGRGGKEVLVVAFLVFLVVRQLIV